MIKQYSFIYIINRLKQFFLLKKTVCQWLKNYIFTRKIYLAIESYLGSTNINMIDFKIVKKFSYLNYQKKKKVVLHSQNYFLFLIKMS